MDFKKVDSRKIFQGRVFAIHNDRFLLPDGREATFDIITHHGAVTLIPVEDGHIWFVRQYRPAAQKSILELPAGTLEVGEAPEVCAAREIREEIGMAAKQLEKIGEFYLAPGYSTEFMHVFLAGGLYESRLAPDDDEFLTVEHIPVETALSAAFAQQIVDAKTLAALWLVRTHLQ